jgi:hypothetical protein
MTVTSQMAEKQEIKRMKFIGTTGMTRSLPGKEARPG